MKKVSFSLMIPSVLLILFIMPVNPVSAQTFNNDFETGDLTDWEADGVAFEFQPTWGDNPTARNRGQPSQHQGDWWLGLYESTKVPIKGKNSDRIQVPPKVMDLKAPLLRLSSQLSAKR